MRTDKLTTELFRFTVTNSKNICEISMNIVVGIAVVSGIVMFWKITQNYGVT
jgi:hypothetical protein